MIERMLWSWRYGLRSPRFWDEAIHYKGH
ncbi:uncharacterized protein METZ01_LOCUS444847, partial [marine metagenome]